MKFELIGKIGSGLSNATGRFGLKVQEKAPEILLVTGVVGVVGCVVLACKATLKAGDAVDNFHEKMDDIHEREENDEEYTKKDAKKDKFNAAVEAGIDLAALYSPAVGVGVFSVTCILVGNNIMRRRYAAVVAAYTSVSTAFDEYRQRVREDGGDDLDRKYRFGTRTETVTHDEVDENGKKKKVKETVEIVDGGPSGYARFFDSSNPNWDRNQNFSLLFLKAQEQMLNNLLNTRGHVFLNEVYDALGFKHSQEGGIVGWKIGNGGDDYIDFGLYNASDENVRRFINGEDNVILLDFNVDGPILNRI